MTKPSKERKSTLLEHPKVQVLQKAEEQQTEQQRLRQAQVLRAPLVAAERAEGEGKEKEPRRSVEDEANRKPKAWEVRLLQMTALREQG